ncbi:hypothetical protein CEN40_02830 [Fischerella thermalis CCMEE 5205]|jgi:hypothetical protein|nr:hypothetical protein CBP13_01080 [Fischerella thermalis WC441]PMB50145.1 hypothetical protein CEN40_02830 [Fischerella thermalis CCMEE 5205]
MAVINKIYPKVLVSMLRREKLICSFSWIVQPVLIAVYAIKQFSLEVSRDLATKQKFCQTNTEHQINWGAPKQTVIGIIY